MSWIVNERARRRHRHEPLIRLGLHPVDMRHARSRQYWLTLVERLLDEGRLPMTKIGWLTQQGLLAPATSDTTQLNSHQAAHSAA